MTEIVNEAAIKVSLDASGVEEGAARIERVAAKTGKTLDSLGGGAGFKNVGEGAGAAAGQIDKATATMAAAIQRTTVAMSAGAKGTAEYYAALASSRGLNTSALRPYLDQLDAVTKKTAAAAEAQRQLETSTRFLDGLRSQADGIGKTASQLAALRAEQLGVTESARPFIEQLREAEEASAGASSSLGGLAQAVAAIGLGGGIAAVAQLSDEYGKYVSQLKLATNGQTEFANAQASVRRIATSAQSDLSATASLYSSITKGTQELGIAQRQVADITETVSLALKVSGASGAEASSAILQLSQAFASGVLRGDEFNSVNEAAPRLMQALADGIGVPTGALRKMAEEGELTTAILADALPRALSTLRDEAKSVETIGGAYTVLKNNILEMVGATAQTNGVVATLSGGISLLAENLTLAAGAALTFAGVKLGAMLDVAATKALNNIAASRALAASNLEAARSSVAATAAASALANARVAELRASVLAAEGNVALAIATNGLIPAQARATAASAAHTAALTAQTAAMGAASVAGRLAGGAMALLGGPVGAVIALLGVAATAWAVWGDSAKKSEEEVSETTKASTIEVLESLDKQIAKLRERNRLAAMGFKPADVQSPGGEKLAEVVGQIDRAGRGEGEYANLNLSARTEILKVLGKQYGDLTSKIAEFNRESETDADNKSAKSAGEWMKKYATNAEKMAEEIAKAKKELGSAFTPELETRITAQFAGRTKGASAEISAYKSLSEAINERVAATAREAASLVPLTEVQKLQARIDGEVASGKLKMTATQKASLQSRLDEIAANEALTASNKRATESQNEFNKAYDAVDKGAATASTAAQAQRDENEAIGLSSRALAELNAQRLGELALRAESKIMMAEGLDITGQMAKKLQDEANAYRERAKAMVEGAAMRESTDASKKALQELNQFLDPSRAETFGEALREAFGSAGESLSRLTATLDGYGKRQAEIAKHRETAENNRGTKDFDEIKYLQTISELDKRRTQDQLSSYGSMASAAAGFFGEQSKGYEALMAVSKVFHAAELAMTLAELVPKGIAAVLNQGTGDPYSAFGRMAAMAAIVAGMGVAIGGIGGSGPNLTENRQRTQGTGTVLGSDAKSESISKSLDMIEDATFQGLSISTGMLHALRNIESNITNFAEFAVKTTTLGEPIDFGSRGSAADFGSSTMGVLATGGVIGLALDKLTGGWVGKINGSVMNKLFGGKTTVEDTGFSVDKIDFASILAGGLNAMQYADIKKEGGLFRSDKYSTQTKSLGEEGNRQFELVLTSLYDSVFEAGKLLGICADDFTAQLNSFVVDIGKISLKGLDDDEIQKELEAVFSKVGDQLAQFGVAGLEGFQKVGEGYLETLTRVATNYQAVTVVTESLGMAFSAVGLDSIAARERLIELSGGLGDFASAAESFMSDFYTDKERADALRVRIQPTLDKFGINTGADDSMDQFRDVVKSLKLETAEGAQAFATLMDIAPAFKQIADVDAAKFEERLELQNQLDQATLTAAQLLDKQREALDGSNRALFDQVQAAEKANRVLDERKGLQEQLDNLTLSSAELLKRQRDALDASNQGLFDQIQLATRAKVVLDERKGLQEQLDSLTMSASQLLAGQRDALDESNRALFDQVQGIKAQIAAQQALKDRATFLLGSVDNAFSVLQRVADREKKAIQSSIDAHAASVGKLQSLSQALRGTLDSLQSPDQQMAARTAGQAQIRAALAIARAGGILPDADSLKSALSAVQRDASDQFSSFSDYMRDLYRTQGDIGELASITDASLSVEEKALAAAQDQLKSLDNMLLTHQEQIDILKGIDTNGLTLIKAMEGLSAAILSARANPVVAAGSAVNAAYQSFLGRAPDAAGQQWWMDQAAAGVSAGAITDAIKNSAEAQVQKLYQGLLGRPADAGGLDFFLKSGASMAEVEAALKSSDEAQKKLRGFAVGANYIPHDMPAMVHEGERIIPAADNRELMARLRNPSENNTVLAAAVERLTATVERQQAVLDRIAASSGQLADDFANATEGGNMMRVEVIQ